MQNLERTVDRFILWLTGHWLAAVNVFLALVLGLALLAPWLMLHGQTRAGQLLYLAFAPLCHQLPERSFFVGGRAPWYTLSQLTALLQYEPPLRYLGNPQLGYKMAFCERDAAIYAGWLAGGLAFALVRRRLRALPWWALILSAVLSLVPIGVDGTVQALGLMQSNWFRRSVTGLLFGVGTIMLVYPLLDRGMNEAHESMLHSREEARATGS